MSLARYRKLLPPRLPRLAARRFSPEDFWLALEPLLDGEFTVEEVGRSVLDRPLRTIRWGRGPERLMLWSQMHGDESTATIALADLVALLATRHDELVEPLCDKVTLLLFPMVNPDGAAAWQRENADGIDLNRDARAARSPEARALRGARDSFDPAFGFNLHDQEVRRTAGPQGNQVAFAFLAPATDPSAGWNPVRTRAATLAASMAETALAAHPAAVARWTDEYEPRAFGEWFQTSDCATVLVETGAIPGDAEKQQLSGDLAALLIGTMTAIADGSWQAGGTDSYHALPLNHSVDHDLQLVGGTLSFRGRNLAADLGIIFDDPVARTGPRIAELGDLGSATALDRRDCRDHLVVLETGKDNARATLAPEIPVSDELHRGGEDGPVTARW